MKAAFGFVSLVFACSASLASYPQTCAEIESAYKQDQITQYDEDCAGEASCVARQISQVREAAKERDPKFDPTMTDAQLEERYGAGHTKLLIGEKSFEGVSLFLNYQTVISYFERGTTTRASISSDSDVTLIGGERCRAPLKPYLSYVRQKNLCLEAITALRADHPQIKIEVGMCMGETSDFWIGNLSDDPSQAIVVVMREPQAPGETQFMCSGAVERATDTILGVDCQVPDDVP